MKGSALLVFFLIVANIITLVSQEDFLFTRSFDAKLEKYEIEFYHPTERWLKASPLIADDFLNYDLVLHSPPDIEIRIDIDEDHYRLFPNVEIQRSLASIATNDEREYIEITQYSKRYARNHYGADLALYADFTPKRSFGSLPNGRLLCLYKEGNALIKIIILYDQDLDPYFKMPMRFKEEGRL